MGVFIRTGRNPMVSDPKHLFLEVSLISQVPGNTNSQSRRNSRGAYHRGIRKKSLRSLAASHSTKMMEMTRNTKEINITLKS
jgi:hypothetical protein